MEKGASVKRRLRWGGGLVLACANLACSTSGSNQTTPEGSTAVVGDDAGSGEASRSAVDAPDDTFCTDASFEAGFGDDAAPDAAPLTFVHSSGTQILAGNGQPLILTGVGLGDWFEQEGYMWNFQGAYADRTSRIKAMMTDLIGADATAAFWQSWYDNFVTEADVARMAQLGFNSVRLPLHYALLLPPGQTTFNEQGFQYLTNFVEWCSHYGMYVIFDMHCAPGGQTGANIDDSADNVPDLFTTPSDQDALVTIWTEIARVFADNPTVAGYDLLNEPLGPGFPQYNAQLWPLYQRITQSIRTVDPNHMLIVEGTSNSLGWADDWTTLGPPFDGNMAYSYHKYWNDPTLASIQTFLDYRTMWKAPIWMGESGENTDAWYEEVFPTAVSQGIG